MKNHFKWNKFSWNFKIIQEIFQIVSEMPNVKPNVYVCLFCSPWWVVSPCHGWPDTWCLYLSLSRQSLTTSDKHLLVKCSLFTVQARTKWNTHLSSQVLTLTLLKISWFWSKRIYESLNSGMIWFVDLLNSYIYRYI